MDFEHLYSEEKDYLESQTNLILDSYKHWFGRDLVDRGSNPVKSLFEAARVVASANASEDPILNFGNQAALDLWEVSWDEFVNMPGRKTAEPMEREARQQFLDEVQANGFVNNYRGVRISKSGKRFEIHNAIVWNLIDSEGRYKGQAATFVEWKYL